MYIIILGSGKSGSKIANMLSKKKHNIVIIDKEEKSFKTLEDDFNGLTVLGNGIDEDIQREAGAEKADIFLSMTDDDNTNIMASQVAKHIFEVPRVITKVIETQHEYYFIKSDINPVCTNDIVAHEIINIFSPGEVQKYSLFGENLKLIKNEIKKKKKIQEFEKENKKKIVALLRGKKTIYPEQSLELNPGDEVFLVDSIK